MPQEGNWFSLIVGVRELTLTAYGLYALLLRAQNLFTVLVLANAPTKYHKWGLRSNDITKPPHFNQRPTTLTPINILSEKRARICTFGVGERGRG